MIGTGIGMLIAGIAAGAGQAAAAKIGSNSAKRAGAMDASAADKQLQFERDQSAQDQANFDKTQALNYEQWANREKQLAPYRAAGSSANTTLANLIGLPMNTDAFQPPPYMGSQPAAAGAPPAANAGGNATVPQRPNDLADAVKQANALAYGYDKHQDASYWQKLWSQDPDYAWKRMLGWQASGADAPTKGPYAGQAAAATAAPRAASTPTTLQSLMASRIAMPSSAPNNSFVRTPALAAPPPSPMTLNSFIQPPRAAYA